jgi:multidrug transporter EmrE-like cation transporter
MDKFYLDILWITLSEIVGDTGLKYYAKNNDFSFFSMGITGYAGVCYYLVQALQNSNILMVNGTWDGFSTLLEGLFAFVVLGERLIHIRQYVGYLLLIVGLFLLRN